MALFESKDKKAARLEAEENAKYEKEFEAKQRVKEEKAKVERLIKDIDKSLESMMQKAANAKQEGFEEVYRQCVLFIKTAKARKKQAKMFLFQMEAMEEMKAISQSSNQLLGSINNIMNSLGKLSIDKSVMMNAQKDFSATQRELNRQSATLDQFLSGMEMNIDDTDVSGDQFSDTAIENEISAFMQGGSVSAPTQSTAPASSSKVNDLDDIKKMLSSM